MVGRKRGFEISLVKKNNIKLKKTDMYQMLLEFETILRSPKC